MSRQVRVRISGDVAARVLLEGAANMALVEKGLPEGARYVRCYDEPDNCDTFVLVFKHESFAEVPSGERIPELEVTMRSLDR